MSNENTITEEVQQDVTESNSVDNETSLVNEEKTSIDSTEDINQIKKITKQDIIEIFSIGKLPKFSDEDYDNIAQIATEYNTNKNIAIYPLLNKTLKSAIDANYTEMYKNKLSNITDIDLKKDHAAKIFFDSIISLIGIKNKVGNLTKKVEKKFNWVKQKIDSIIGDNYLDTLNNLDKIKETDTERYENIMQIKAGFDMTDNFDYQLGYLNNDNPRNVKRYHQHFNDDTKIFSEMLLVNGFGINSTTDILHKLSLILKQYPKTKHYSIDIIKACCVLISRSCMNLDIENLKNMAYIHKLIRVLSQSDATPNQIDLTVYDRLALLMNAIENKLKKK